MKLGFSEPQRHFVSGSQTARAVTEAWAAQFMYCPNCGNANLIQFQANLPVADFFCPECSDQYELKSQKKEFGSKVADGAYRRKIERLESNSSPNLILLKYDQAVSEVRSVSVIPKRFFVPLIVEKRKPLGPSARRAGWIGSNILLSKVPDAGRIQIVRDGAIVPKELVLAQWQKTAFLAKKSQDHRGWLLETMRCIDHLGAESFSLDQIYGFEGELQKNFPQNNNVRPKLRQQLQVLRDNGYLEFLGNGKYRLLR